MPFFFQNNNQWKGCLPVALVLVGGFLLIILFIFGFFGLFSATTASFFRHFDKENKETIAWHTIENYRFENTLLASDGTQKKIVVILKSFDDEDFRKIPFEFYIDQNRYTGLASIHSLALTIDFPISHQDMELTTWRMLKENDRWVLESYFQSDMKLYGKPNSSN